MLTKGDLSSIRKLFDESFDRKFDESFDRKFDESFDRKFDEKFENAFNKHTKSIKDDIVHVRKDQKLIIRFFDREYLDLRKRVERIESFLKFSGTN